MQKRVLGVAGAAVVLGGIAASGLALADGGNPDGGSAPAATVVASDPKTLPRDNPDAGLTDEERHAKYASARESFWTRYEAWAEAFNDSNIDLRTLEQAEVDGSWLAPEPTLAVAALKAELIVEVESVEMDFGAHGSSTIFEVHSTLKGETGSRIRVEIVGGLFPQADWSFESAILGSAPNAPLLLPGDRAVLFLAKDAHRDVYVIQPGSGFYWVEAGAIVPLEMNPFGGDVAGMTVAEFGEAVR